MRFPYWFCLGFTAMVAAGCKKEQQTAPPPVTPVAAAPAQEQVAPGMEAENPAEKEGEK